MNKHISSGTLRRFASSVIIVVRGSARDVIIVVLASTVAATAYPVVFLWFIQFVNDPGQTSPYASGSPFTLAQVMAIFGAFGVAGGFSTYGSPGLRLNLRRVGVSYILSALGFSFLGMTMPILPLADEGTYSQTVLLVLTLGAFLVVAVTFYFGTLMLLISIGSLLAGDDEHEKRDECRGQDESCCRSSDNRPGAS